MMCYSLLCLYLGINHAEGQILHRSPAHFAMFGDIGSFDDLFLSDVTPDENTKEIESTQELDNIINHSLQLKFNNEKFKENNTHKSSSFVDEKEFYEINLSMEHFTRKRLSSDIWSHLFGWFLPWGPKTYDHEDFEITNVTRNEEIKTKMLRDIGLQLLFHSRKKIEGAFLIREKVRQDKRYKLGYLFNKLRHQKYEMNKVIDNMKFITYAHNETDFWYAPSLALQEVTGTLRMMETVSHMDVDIRDTCNLIRTIYNTPAPYDNIQVKSKSG